MKTIQNISVVEDVTLVSLNDSPADMNTISKIFDMISTNNIDVSNTAAQQQAAFVIYRQR